MQQQRVKDYHELNTPILLAITGPAVELVEITGEVESNTTMIESKRTNQTNLTLQCPTKQETCLTYVPSTRGCADINHGSLDYDESLVDFSETFKRRNID